MAEGRKQKKEKTDHISQNKHIFAGDSLHCHFRMLDVGQMALAGVPKRKTLPEMPQRKAIMDSSSMFLP